MPDPKCSAPGCWAPAHDSPGGVPLCFGHLSDVREALGLCAVAGREAQAAPPECTSVVYYVSLDGGQTIKIGTTTSPEKRFRALGKRATGVVLVMAAVPGSYREERAEHWTYRRDNIQPSCGECNSITGGRLGAARAKANREARDVA